MRSAGLYFDGVVAVGRPALIESDGADLVIRDAGGEDITRWRIVEVERADADVERDDLRLKRSPPSLDRFVVADAGAAQWLISLCPRLRRGSGGRRPGLRAAAIVGLAVALFIGFIEAVLPRIADSAARVMPASWEAGLGRLGLEQAMEVLRARSLCTRPEGVAALERLTASLAATADRPLAVRTKVVDSRVVNAFALPDGQVLLSRGLIAAARHPDELAGVVAHEIGHVAHRHPTAVALRVAGGSIVLGALFGDVGGGSLLGGVATDVVATRYSREAEREADDFGAVLMDRAGYDRHRLADLLQRMQDEDGETPYLAFLSTHPPTGERLDALLSEPGDASGRPALGEADWSAVQRMCD